MIQNKSYETRSHQPRSAPFTNTNFSKKQFNCGTYHPADDSSENLLRWACWSGLIFEILPDIFDHSSQEKNACIWTVIPAENFVDVKIGATPYLIECAMSIDP
jgi:hypothetical protein